MRTVGSVEFGVQFPKVFEGRLKEYGLDVAALERLPRGAINILQEKTPVPLLQDSLKQEPQGRAHMDGIGMSERLDQIEAWQVGFVEANVLIVLEFVSQDATTFDLNE
jgi:hypothetical protein